MSAFEDDPLFLEALRKHEHAEKARMREINKARAVFEKQPGFAAAQVRMREQTEEVERHSPALASGFGTKERAEYLLKLFDIHASAFLELVSDIETQNAFIVLLEFYEWSAKTRYSGFNADYSESVSKEARSTDHAFHKRTEWWTLQGYKRVASRQFFDRIQEDPNSDIGPKRLSDRDVRIHDAATQPPESCSSLSLPVHFLTHRNQT